MISSKRLARGMACTVGAAIALHSPGVFAEMIGPEAAMPGGAAAQTEADRAKVQQFLERASVRERLQAMGVQALNARDRVDSLTQEEVHALAQRIDSMPAGGNLSQNDLIIILLVAILVIVAL
jgi:hypothetical protein